MRPLPTIVAVHDGACALRAPLLGETLNLLRRVRSAANVLCNCELSNRLPRILPRPTRVLVVPLRAAHAERKERLSKRSLIVHDALREIVDETYVRAQVEPQQPTHDASTRGKEHKA